MLNDNLRKTKQKEVILTVLKDSRTHLDAMEIFRRAAQKMPRLSPATVYRNLRMLKEQGLVEQSLFGEDHAHYELVTVSNEHQHFKCISCGRVEEFDLSTDELLAKISKAQGFQITHTKLYIEGICSVCQKKNDNY